VKELRESFESLRRNTQESTILSFSPIDQEGRDLRNDFLSYLSSCQEVVRTIQSEIYKALSMIRWGPPKDSCAFPLWIRLTPMLLLEQLSRNHWYKRSYNWQKCLVQYAIALTNLQRARRLLNACDSGKDLLEEIQLTGHQDWKECMGDPEWLLFEVENSLLIRPNQSRTAKEMILPRSRNNAILQLNMGEGKSSVVVPIAASTLASGPRLVRIIVMKSQFGQMLHNLRVKLGGLLNRRVYSLPISRESRITLEEGKHILRLLAQCKDNGAILLMQLDQILSFKLLGLETFINGNAQLGQTLIKWHQVFESHSRDIVDESDEIFNAKHELVYSMGSQQALEFRPQRWQLIQAVLGELSAVLRADSKKLTGTLTIEQDETRYEAFPMICITQEKTGKQFLNSVARRICELGLEGLSRIPQPLINKVYNYITAFNISEDEASSIESDQHLDLQALLVLRGLFACGTLLFALQKRWRVNYGLDGARLPKIALAVPYRAKDTPSPRSEYSHPDFVIILTSLSYYYGGLQEDELFLTFQHLLESDQPEFEYSNWAKANPTIPEDLCNHSSINISDETHCVDVIFPFFKRSKVVIDYYLSNIVFPREMFEFKQKLSATSWDLTGDSRGTRRCVTTGFSGTNDAKYQLPLAIEQLHQLEEQPTNAKVLDTILRPENTVQRIIFEHGGRQTVGLSILQAVVQSDRQIDVILDVGAQILDLDNLEVARTWLQLEQRDHIEAVITFNDSDELTVLNRAGLSESFLTSPYSTRTSSCLVFLDEAHTRGTDLRLPEEYRAAVVVGPNMPKDKLVQGKSDLLLFMTAC